MHYSNVNKTCKNVYNVYTYQIHITQFIILSTYPANNSLAHTTLSRRWINVNNVDSTLILTMMRVSPYKLIIYDIELMRVSAHELIFYEIELPLHWTRPHK